MLIYKGMNVFPTAIRDLVSSRFGDRVEPLLRVWKTRTDQVRFDDPIEVDVELLPGCDDRSAGLAQAIEDEVRAQLQVRVRVTVLAAGSLQRGAYKNPLLAVRDGG